MKKNFAIIFLLFFYLNANGQQISRLSNYIYNQLYFNPAASGMYEQQLNISVLNKFQWYGIKGSPLLSILWLDYKTKEKGLSVGAVIDRFSYGATRKTGISFNPSYSILLGYKLRLAMGVRVGMDQMVFNTSILQNVFDEGDDLLGSEAFQQTFLKIGAGFQLRSSKFHLGLASSDLFINDKYYRYNPDSLGFFSKPRNFVLNSGYKLVLNDSYTLIPSAIVYAYKRNKIVTGTSLIFEIKDYFWAGANYYTNSMLSFTIGTHISSRIRFAYSYEVAFSKKLPSRLSSHEVNLLFKMDKVSKKRKSI
jgi:type IX secretion system PorP/SprF family membrane protein